MEIDKANVALKTNSCTQIKKRSSLKMNDSISKGELEQLQQRCKRLSVNWDKSINFKSLNMKNIKTSFDDNIAKGNDDIMKLKLFNEKRKNSIKNEFGLVREFLKSANIDEVDEEDENAITIKENTTLIANGKIHSLHFIYFENNATIEVNNPISFAGGLLFI